MRDRTLSKIVRVADRGFTPAANRRYLRRGDHHYIIGEKLRSGSAEAAAALSRQGRYQEITGNLRVKEVRIAEDERFVICPNPEAAERDAATRARLLAQLKEMIDGTGTLSAIRRAELRGVISTKPGLNRYLRVTPGGLPRIGARAVRAGENLDGKYLLRASDPRLPAADIAAGYKQLLEVERGWRTMKQVIDLRPVYHRLEQRIRAHVILRWLALLLIRIAETTADTTWNKISDELSQLTLGTFTGPAGTFPRPPGSPPPSATSPAACRSPARTRSSKPPPPQPPRKPGPAPSDTPHHHDTARFCRSNPRSAHQARLTPAERRHEDGYPSVVWAVLVSRMALVAGKTCLGDGASQLQPALAAAPTNAGCHVGGTWLLRASMTSATMHVMLSGPPPSMASSTSPSVTSSRSRAEASIWCSACSLTTPDRPSEHSR
jgi:hypothetical protein